MKIQAAQAERRGTMQAKFPEAVSGLFQYLNEAGKRYWQRLSSVAEFDRLDGQEKTRIANELGISGDELRILASKDKNSADLLLRRMETIGLQPCNINPAVMRDLQRCCSNCRDKVVCLHELEDKPRKVTWPSYCPNEATLGALTDEQTRRTALKKRVEPPTTPSKPTIPVDHDGGHRGGWLF
jgi:hypothetical protein